MIRVTAIISRIILASVPIKASFPVANLYPFSYRDFVPVLYFTSIILTGSTERLKSAFYGFASSAVFRQCCLHSLQNISEAGTVH